MSGDLSLHDSAQLSIAIRGNNFGDYDRLEVAGNAELGGTLRVELPNQRGGPYVPKLGDHFGFLAASGGAGGLFDDFDFPALAAGLAWALSPGNVTVFLEVVAALPGDYNFNGVVDAADYTVWRNSLGKEGIGLVADGSHNDRVDAADYAVWKSHFGIVLGSGGLAGGESNAVPEPNCMVLSGLLMAWLAVFVRRIAN